MQPEHPENDLTSDADYANLARPAPRDFDELADQPDPLAVAAANRASSRQALLYLAAIVLGSALVALALAAILRTQGGPYCDAGIATWLCSQNHRLIWGIAVMVLPFAGMVGCAVIMVRKLRAYLRWRTWMGVFWVLTPHFMLWGIIGMQTAMISPE